MSAAIIKTEASQKRRNFISKFLIYFFLIVITSTNSTMEIALA